MDRASEFVEVGFEINLILFLDISDSFEFDLDPNPDPDPEMEFDPEVSTMDLFEIERFNPCGLLAA